MRADLEAAGSIKVIVVDDHEAVRTGLERVLDRAPDLEPVAGLADDRDVFSLVAREDVDVAVLDYDLERGDGLSLCWRLKQREDAPAVVIYSGYAGPSLAFAASVAQADAVVSKAEPVEVLLSTVRRLAAGDQLLEPPAPELVEAAAACVSIEDLPVMALLADGVDTNGIATALGLDARDVGRRAQRVIGRLQAGSERKRGRMTTAG